MKTIHISKQFLSGFLLLLVLLVQAVSCRPPKWDEELPVADQPYERAAVSVSDSHREIGGGSATPRSGTGLGVNDCPQMFAALSADIGGQSATRNGLSVASASDIGGQMTPRDKRNP